MTVRPAGPVVPAGRPTMFEWISREPPPMPPADRRSKTLRTVRAMTFVVAAALMLPAVAGFVPAAQARPAPDRLGSVASWRIDSADRNRASSPGCTMRPARAAKTAVDS